MGPAGPTSESPAGPLSPEEPEKPGDPSEHKMSSVHHILTFRPQHRPASQVKSVHVLMTVVDRTTNK